MLVSQRGFSLIELLAVIAIIGLLAAIAIPQFAEYRASSFRSRVQTDLRHLATAEEAYFVDHQTYRSCQNTTCVSRFPGFMKLSQGVTLQITATTSGFTGTAGHPQLDAICRWDNSQAGFLGCS